MQDKGIPGGFEPARTRPFNGGEQKLYRFDNGFGASVIRNPHSYGGESGLWELAVITWDDNKFTVVRTPITAPGLTLGWVDDAELDATLAKIKALEPSS